MQQLTEYLKDYSAKLDAYLRDHFAKQKQNARDIDPFLVGCMDDLEKFMIGGKKIRGRLIGQADSLDSVEWPFDIQTNTLRVSCQALF